MHIYQPFPYQGSKRRLAPLLLRYVPKTRTLYEPFAGSGAFSLAAASKGAAQQFVLGDSYAPLVGIWQQILEHPDLLCDAYERIYDAQFSDPRGYYDTIRETFNRTLDPAQFLFLVARCVKNAVRFNQDGKFNQSPDKRRVGVSPATLRARIKAAHAQLAGRATAICADYAQSLRLAGLEDLVYMDPPYMGVSGKRDGRYHQALDYERFVDELSQACQRGVSFMVSFDGRCGGRTYGPGLPEALGLRHVELHAGRSSQATLHGRVELTVESLYLSPALVMRIDPVQDVPVRP